MKLKFNNITINGGGFWGRSLMTIPYLAQINKLDNDCGFRIVRRVI